MPLHGPFGFRNGFWFTIHEPFVDAESGIKHHTTIAYSKEETRATFCLIKVISKTGMTERVLNTSVEQPLCASPNTLLFGNAVDS